MRQASKAEQAAATAYRSHGRFRTLSWLMDKATPESAPVHGTCMTPQERVNLVLAFARVLYVNGQATEQTVDAAERLARSLGLRAKMMLRWGELRLEDRDTKAVSAIAADPVGVDMNRVASW